MDDAKFHRDASDRLTYELFHVESDDYPAVCDEVGARFRPVQAVPQVAGLSVILREYQCGPATVCLEWDNWSGFLAVANDTEAESLVREIGAYLSQSKWATRKGGELT